MPQIKQYETPALGLRPTETGINAVAGAARRVQGEYNEAAAAQTDTGQRVATTVRDAGEIALKATEHFEISRGAKTLAETQNRISKQWEDTAKNADPNDPTVAQRFIDQVNPDLDKLKDGFLTERGQQFAEHSVDQFRQHLFVKTSADMATMAGEAAKVNLRQTVNSLSNSVRSDPSSMNFSLQTLEHSVGEMVDSSPNLTGGAAAKVKTELLQKAKEEVIKSAALGHIEKTGEVPGWASDPKYSPYINGAELKQFAQAARYYSRLGESESRAARIQRDYENKADFNRRANELEVRTAPQNPGDPPQLPQDYWEKIRELSRHPGAEHEPGRLKSMVENGERITARLDKPEPLGPVSHETTMGLMQRMRAQDGKGLQSDDEIYKAYFDGKLNNADFNFLRNEYANMKTPAGDALNRERSEFFKRFEGFIDPEAPMGMRSKEGQARFYSAEMAARRMEDEARKAGKSPHDVYDPDSPYFFGRPANMLKYGPQSLQDNLRGNAPVITDKAEFDKLPGGAEYIRNGKRYRKP